MKTTRRGSQGSPNSLSNRIRKGLAESGISTRSIVAFVVFGIIILVFVLSDLSGRKGGGSSMGAAAEVNGQIISIKDFQDEENRLSQYYAQLFGGQFDMGAQQSMLRGEVMNSLVTKAVTWQAAEKEGIFATDAEVRKMITEDLPYFKKEGVFQTDAYKAVLSANRLTPGEFEKKLRQDIVSQRSRQLFEASVGATDLQKSAEQDLKATKINVEYATLNLADYIKSHDVSGDVIQKNMADATFSKRVSDYFNTNKAEFETKEQIKASHILIRSAADEPSVKKAQEKAEAVLKRLQKEDFAKVAGQVSEDPGSKAKNGDLGYFGRGQMVKEFEDTAFTLAPGKMSGLVKTSYGFHIIKVTDKKAATTASLETAQKDIAKKLILSDEYSAVVKSIESALAEGKVDEAMKQLTQNKVAWKETGFFDLSMESIPGLNSAQMLKAALELTKANPVAKKLIREGDTQYLLKFKDMNTASAVASKNDSDNLSRQKSSEAYRQWIDGHRKKSDIETNTALLQNPAK